MDEDILDDQDRMTYADIGQMLPALATAGAQVRQSWDAACQVDLAALDKPRSVIISAVGGSAQAGDLMAAVVGFETSVPVQVVRGSALPGWVGPLDLVCALSCSGYTRETITAAYEAIRRGCQVVGVGSANSPLAETVRAGTGDFFIPITPGTRPPRMMMWSLATPLLAVANAIGLGSFTEPLINDTADRLDAEAVRCGPASSWAVNPAKDLAVELADHLPLVWGAGEVGRAVGRRFVGQLAENAKRPAVYAAFPEAAHGQIVTLDGHYGPQGPVSSLQLVLVRDGDEPEHVRALADAAVQVAHERGVHVTQLRGEGEHPLLRLAGLSSTADFASVYAALGAGVDPQPITAIDQIKDLLAARDR